MLFIISQPSAALSVSPCTTAANDAKIDPSNRHLTLLMKQLLTLFLLLSHGLSVCADDFAYSKNLIACQHAFSTCDVNRLTEEDRLRYSTKKIRLSPEVQAQLKSAQTTSESNAKTAPNRQVQSPSYGCAENGSCYGEMSGATGRAKTVHVQGYYRKDGTYVRGHYRSKPR